MRVHLLANHYKFVWATLCRIMTPYACPSLSRRSEVWRLYGGIRHWSGMVAWIVRFICLRTSVTSFGLLCAIYFGHLQDERVYVRSLGSAAGMSWRNKWRA